MNTKVTTICVNPAIDMTIEVCKLTFGEVNRASRVRTNPGGKGVNVAALLADAGLEVTVTGFLGLGNAAIFDELFARKGIHGAFVGLPGDTRTSVKLVEPESGTTTDINAPGLSPGPDELRALKETVAALAKDSAWVVLAGSLPPGVSADLYAELTELARARGAKVALDASGPGLAAGLAAKPTLAKPNREELEVHLGRALDSPEALLDGARELKGRGVSEVVVSLGEEGALFVGRETLWARPPEVEVASTVGAGDAMVSGLVAASCAGLGAEAAARKATAFAAHVVSIVGNHLPAPAALAALEARVRVDRWTAATPLRSVDAERSHS